MGASYSGLKGLTAFSRLKIPGDICFSYGPGEIKFLAAKNFLLWVAPEKGGIVDNFSGPGAFRRIFIWGL